MSIDLPLIVPGIRLSTGDVETEMRKALEWARQPWVAGFCLFGGERDQVTALLERLRDLAGRPLFVASDMENGAGQQVAGLRELPEAAIWGLGGGPDEVRAFARMTAEDALEVGVDVLFAPVLDVMSEPSNPIVGTRAYGWDPDRVAALGVAFMQGALEAGVVPVAKHYPGHGATDADSHDAVPVVRDDRRRLLARDLFPFQAALAAGVCPALMSAHVVYPSLDSSGRVATLSRPILDDLRALPGGAEAAVFTDALCMAGVLGEGGEPEAARLSLEAGCDFLLCPDDPEAVAAGLSEVSAAGLERATRRVRGFFDVVEATRQRAPAALAPHADHDLVARVVRQAVHGAVGTLAPALELLVLDDDGVETRGDVLVARARAEDFPCRVVRPPFEGAALGSADTVVVMASLRAWKGGRLSEGGRRLLARLRAEGEARGRPPRVLWMGARPESPEPHVPGTAAQVEEAVADVLLTPLS